MEYLIGTILLSGRKTFKAKYRLFFTESRVLAIDISDVLPNTTVMRSITGDIESDIEQSVGGIKLTNPWDSIVIDINTSNKPLVSYDEKLSDELLRQPNISIPYDKVKSVVIKKVTKENIELSKVQYSISFTMGLFSSESFLIPGMVLDATTELIKKTPLVSKLKS